MSNKYSIIVIIVAIINARTPACHLWVNAGTSRAVELLQRLWWPFRETSLFKWMGNGASSRCCNLLLYDFITLLKVWRNIFLRLNGVLGFRWKFPFLDPINLTICMFLCTMLLKMYTKKNNSNFISQIWKWQFC